MLNIPFEFAVMDAQWFLAALASNRDFNLQIDGNNRLVPTLRNAIKSYQEVKGGTFRNRNKSLSVLLVALLESLKINDIDPNTYKFDAQELIPPAKLDISQGLTLSYKLFLIIYAILSAEKENRGPTDLKEVLSYKQF